MNILFVTHYYPATVGGGIELVVRNLKRELESQGLSCEWLAMDDGSGDGIPCYDGVRLKTDLAFPLPWPPSTWGPSLRKMWGAVGRATVVHVHEPYYPLCWTAVVMARLRGKRVVITQHISDYPASPLRSLVVTACNALVGSTMRLMADRVAVISRRVQKKLPGSVYIPNGVDRNHFYFTPRPRDCKTCLFVGRFVAKKNPGYVVDLARHFPNHRFRFIGHGPLDPACEPLPNVEVLGYRDADFIREQMLAADILLLPSVGEGFPLVVQESLCCGLPCMVSREIIEACPDASFGLLDAGPLGKLLRDNFPSCFEIASNLDRQQIATQASAMWGWDRCARQYVDLCYRVLEATP